MAILLIPGKFNADSWSKALRAVDPNLDIRIWPDVGDRNAIDFALVWTYPPGELLKYPNLKCISSMGAGVDQIFRDPDRPKNVAVVRVIDQLLVRDMTQYIVLAVLNHMRLFDLYQTQQLRQAWKPHHPHNESTIGIMGLGQLGTDTAKKLLALRLKVIGWSKTAKAIENMSCFYGQDQFSQFLSQAKILVNLLPLTAETQHILNAQTFSQLPKDAYLINVARGNHLVDEDLIAAIDAGQLSGACLDVFATEPLPETHPFWRHPQIKVTPHIASVTNPQSVAPQIVENYQRMLAGKPLLHAVDLTKGY